jgi:pilus assembly protein CpaE
VRSIGVAVVHPDPGVVDELVHAIEAAPDLYLAIDPAKASVVLAGAVALLSLAAGPPSPRPALVGIAVDGDVQDVARAAVRCRAEDLVCWPRDGDVLCRSIREAASRARISASGAEGKVVAVVGARGGAGTTTVTGLLAGALPESALVDLDPAGDGQSAFVPPSTDPTLETVLEVVDELDPGGLQSALTPHAAGRALCASPRRRAAGADRIERLVALLRATVPYAIADVGRGSDDGGRVAVREADAVVCVCAPDLQSMRGARALGESLPGVRYVLNMATRLRLSPRDVSRVLGAPPVAVIPLDATLRKAGEAGRLPSRGPARRATNRLAALLSTELSDGR